MNRISAEAFLQFFNPLKAWLEQQNRHDNIGWNSNMEDVALFKAISSGSIHQHWTFLTHFSIFLITVSFYFF